MMISKNIFSILSMLSLTMAGCDGPVPTRAEIAEKYPDVEQGSARPENTRVLCPFVRILERAGLFDDEVGIAAYENGYGEVRCQRGQEVRLRDVGLRCGRFAGFDRSKFTWC